MADQMNRKRFRSREEYVAYRKAMRRRKFIRGNFHPENFAKPVANPYERNIREKLFWYVLFNGRDEHEILPEEVRVLIGTQAKLPTISYR